MASAIAVVGLISSVAGLAGNLIGGSQQKSAYADQANAQQDQAYAQEQAARAQDEAAYQQEIAAQGQVDAAYESERLADANARNQEMETLETVRREDAALSQEISEARARAAASGTVLDEDEGLGSVIAANRKEGNTQIDWLKRAGVNQAEILRWQGDIARKSGLSTARQTLADAAYTRSQADQTRFSAGISRKYSKLSRKKGDTALWSGIFDAVGAAPAIGAAWSKI